MAHTSSTHDATNDSPAITRVGTRIAPFWKNKPDLWFMQLEAQFETGGISVDDTKYYYVLQALDDESLSEVCDILRNPPTTGRYAVLKSRLIKSFEDSAERKLRTLLGDLDLGERRPSQLLRRMRDLAQNNIADEALKSLWLQRLPSQVQAILSASPQPLDELAQLADRIHEVITPTASGITSVSAQSADLGGRLASIEARLEALGKHSYRRSQSRRSTSSPRNRSNSRSKTQTCWYHTKFGSRAVKYSLPCDWKSKQAPEN